MSELVQVEVPPKTDTEIADVFFSNSPKIVEDVIKPTVPPVAEPEAPVAEPDGENPPVEELELKIPDGSQVTEAQMLEVKEFAKANNLTKEAAQSLLEKQSVAMADVVKKQNDQYQERAGKWVQDIKADKELGGENYSESVELARRAIEKFASPELKKTLDETKLGNHPELVRVFKRIGQELANPKLVQAPKSPAVPTNLEDKFWGSTLA